MMNVVNFSDGSTAWPPASARSTGGVLDHRFSSRARRRDPGRADRRAALGFLFHNFYPPRSSWATGANLLGYCWGGAVVGSLKTNAVVALVVRW